MSKMIVDTNVLLRIFIDDDGSQNKVTRGILEKVNNGEIVFWIPNEVIMETIWVLESYYKLNREIIANALSKLLGSHGVEYDFRMYEAVRQYGDCKYDIVDIYLSVLAKSSGISVLSWDRDFRKLECESYNPGDILR